VHRHNVYSDAAGVSIIIVADRTPG
jgi:hypothetical protein